MHLQTLHSLDPTYGTVQLRSRGNNSISNNDDTTRKQEEDPSPKLILVPTPSPTNPNDPLHWPSWKKHLSFTTICLFTFLTNFALGGLSPAFPIIALEFQKTQSEVSNLLVYPILVLGAFNFLWIPLANYVGKRPVFLFCSLLLFIAYIWGALAQTFSSLLWSNITAAFAGASTEALAASMVCDVYFLHERGSKMGWYMNAISGGNTIGPLVCGFLVTAESWRWQKWIAAILCGVNFGMVVFGVPETGFDRRIESMGGMGEKGLRDEEVAVEAKATEEKGDDEIENGVVSSSSSPSPSPSETNDKIIPKKTYWQELSPWSGSITPNTNLLKVFIRPLPMVFYPAVVYGFLTYAISLVLVVAINLLNPFVLQAPPYNWKPSIDGLINIPGFIGNVIGGYAGGWLVDKFCDWRTKRKNGVFEPESRLHLLIIPLLITGAGCLVFGYGVQETLHWTALFFGYGMISFSLTAVPTITMAYVSDSMLPVNEDALMLVNGSKNIVAFGFLYGINPWVASEGYVNTFGALTGIFVAILLLGGLPLILFGSKIRHVQSQWRLIL